MTLSVLSPQLLSSEEKYIFHSCCCLLFRMYFKKKHTIMEIAHQNEAFGQNTTQG